MKSFLNAPGKALMVKVAFIILVVLAAVPYAAGADTRKLAYERHNAVWIASINGMDSKRITPGNLPEISPDGTRIAFNTDEGGEKTPVRHIAVADLATGKVEILKDIPSDNSYGPAWSPDGKALLFSTYIDKDWQLAFVNADGSGFRILNKAEGPSRSLSQPEWAPDGKSYFCHDLDAIYRFDLDGKQIAKWDLHTVVTDGDMDSNSRISISPDGKFLLMDIDMNEQHYRGNWDGPPPALFLLDLNTGKATRLTGKDEFAWEPFWISQDEFLFLMQAPNEHEPSVYRGSIHSKNFKFLVPNAWSPTASR